MDTSANELSQLLLKVTSAVGWAVAVLIAVLIGGLWLLKANQSIVEAIPLALMLLSMAAAAIIWRQFRGRFPSGPEGIAGI